MNTDENGKEVVKEKPQIYFKSIRFNDDTELMLEKNSIVVFTGANNSGKSQVLKDIESSLDCTNHIEKVVVKTSESDYCGEIGEKSFLAEHFYKDVDGNYRSLESGFSFETSSLEQFWKGRTLYNIFIKFSLIDLQDRLKQVTRAKNKLANQMDNLSVSDKHYDKKYEDMQVRLDKLYDEIEEIETLIEEAETRLYNIRQEKISGDNVYQFLLFFDKLYDRFTDMEKKAFMKSFIEEVNIYEAEQKDGRILRSLKFRFPVFFNNQELYELDWDNESTVECVVLMSKVQN